MPAGHVRPELKIGPMDDALGAEAVGVDLGSRWMTRSSRRSATVLRHHLLVFRCLLHSTTDFDWMKDVRIMRRTTTVGEHIDSGVAVAAR